MFAATMVVLASCLAVPSTPYSVGVAKIDITPNYPVRLNGFGFRREESSEVRSPIWVKALVISDTRAEGPLVLLMAETLGIPDSLHARVAERLSTWGVTTARVAILATHTHTAPMVNHVSPTIFGMPIPADQQQRIDRYSDELLEALVRAATLALESRVPANLSWSQGSVGFAANRRTKDGPVDHTLPLLAAHDADGKLLAVWVTYACHCVTLSDNRVSGDWAGFAQAAIEHLHPGCVGMVSIGCGADANPNSGVTGDKGEIAQAQGAEIATEVHRLLEQPRTPLTAPVTTREDRLRLPLAPLPSREAWQERSQRNDAIGYHARVQLARLDRHEPLPTEINYPIRSWAFGDQLNVIYLPGEVVVDYAIRLRKELDANRIWIHGYANHCPGYVPSERILREGGYEGGGAMVYYDIPGPYAPGLEDQIVQTVKAQSGATFLAQHDNAPQPPAPLAPAEALRHFALSPDLAIELVAAEPEVTSPVAMAEGVAGELWVAEMYDYPSGIDGNFAPGGRIRRLQDRDRDGRWETSVVFLDRRPKLTDDTSSWNVRAGDADHTDPLPFPTGVTPWRDGVLICAAPDILFARDTDGDGRADEVKRLFTGFGNDNYQARVNSLEFGLDGWVYGSCGLFGGTIVTAAGERVALGDRDFRCRPDTLQFEAATGRTQQGRVRDDAGNWFGCENGNLIFHHALDDHQLRRNSDLSIERATFDALAPEDLELFPTSRPMLFALSGPAGRATAACGLGIYRDAYLGEAFQGNSFTCESVNNLVTRRVLKYDGVHVSAVRAEPETNREFLSSDDIWFRPVQARTASDGSLYVVDMYRLVIEHPRWIPAESLAHLDVRAGADRGRIYRIVRRDRQPTRGDALGDDWHAWIAPLSSANGSRRDLATQRFFWMNDGDRAAAEPAIRQLLASPVELARVHALSILEVWQRATEQDLVTAMSDRAAVVRRHAVRIAATRSRNAKTLQAAILTHVNDADDTVVREVAYALGEGTSQEIATALAQLIRRTANDDILLSAALSSLNDGNLVPITEDLYGEQAASLEDPAQRIATALTSRAVALNQPDALRRLIAAARRNLDGPAPLPALQLLRSVARALDRAAAAGATADGHADLLHELREPLEALVDRCRQWAVDSAQPVERRVAAIGVLGDWPSTSAEDASLLLRLLSAAESIDVQLATLSALPSKREAGDFSQACLQLWPVASPVVRERMVASMLQRKVWTTALLAAIEAKVVNPADVTSAQQSDLLHQDDEALAQRAASALGVTLDSDRQRLIQRYLDELPSSSDASTGRKVFTQKCSSCHRLDTVGNEVGPDIRNYATKPKEAFVNAVLDPNQAVDPRYVTCVVELTDGRVLTGLVRNESSSGFTLLDGQGRPATLLRSEVDALTETRRSLMPEGLEREVSPTDVLNIYQWLRALPPAGR